MAEAPVSEHDCDWQVINIQHVPSLIPFQRDATIVLMRCTICKLPETTTLSGHWSLEQLR